MTYQEAVVEQMKRSIMLIGEFAPTVIIFASFVHENGQGAQIMLNIGDQASQYGMCKEYIATRERYMGGGPSERIDL